MPVLAREETGHGSTWAAFGHSMLEAAESILRRMPAPVRHHRFGPLALDVQVVGKAAFERRLLRALQGSRAEAGTSSAFRLIVIDGAADIGAGRVSGLMDCPPGLDFSSLQRCPELGLTLRYFPELGTWRAWSVPRRLAVNWIADARLLPDWEDGFPFRNLLHWMSFGTGWTLVHAAGIGRGGKGVLLAGAGGSGKSTTAAAAVLAGFETIGDDFVLVEPDAARAHLVYDCLKFDEASLALLPPYRDMVDTPAKAPGLKSLVHLSGRLPSRLSRNFGIQAIVVPRVTRSGKTRLRPATAGDALRALLPSTAFQLSGGGPEIMRKLAALTRLVPVHALEIGGTPAEAAATLESLLPGSA